MNIYALSCMCRNIVFGQFFKVGYFNIAYAVIVNCELLNGFTSIFSDWCTSIFSISSFNILGVSFLALVYLRTDVINIRSAYSVAKQKILNKTIYKKAKIVYNKLINIIKPNVKQKGEIKYVLYRNRFGRNKYCGRNRG